MNTNSLFKLFEMAFIIGILLLFSSCMSMMALPNHSSGNHHSTGTAVHSEGSFDVVCGKSIEGSQQSFSTQYKNKNYYFDSEDCLNKFQQSPESYLKINSSNHKNNSLLYLGIGAASMGILMLFMIQ